MIAISGLFTITKMVHRQYQSPMDLHGFRRQTGAAALLAEYNLRSHLDPIEPVVYDVA